MRAREMKDRSTPISVDLLNPACKIHCADNYAKIKDSIEREGLRYPLVVLNTTVGTWRDLHEENPDATLPCPGNFLKARCYMVMIGNNRLKAAQEMGVEEIDCIVVDDRMEVNALAKVMRGDWVNESKS